MSKVKKIAAGAALVGTAAATVCIVKKVKRAYQLELENCTGEALDLSIGTEAAPDAIALNGFEPARKEHVDLTRLPLSEHDVVYIRFAQKGDRPSYKRTLIYDTDECSCAMRAMIVDYGDNNYDVKLVKLG